MTTTDSQSHEELLDALRQLTREIGHSPTMADYRAASGYPPVSHILETFGSWNKAKQAADLPTFQKEGRGTTYSRQELIEQLRRLAQAVEGPVTKQDVIDCDFCPSAVTYQRQFGSWNAAKEAAGIPTIEADDTPVQYTDEELCNLLRALADELDHPVTIHDVEAAADMPDPSTYERRFGSWNQAKQVAGLDTIDKGGGSRGDSYSDTVLLNQLRDWAANVDGPLTATALDQAPGYPSASTYKRRFGSWTAAKKAAGLSPEHARCRYTDEQLIEFLQDLRTELDRPITRTDVTHAEDLPDVSTFERRFGSWNEAKAAAGLKRFDQGERPTDRGD